MLVGPLMDIKDSGKVRNRRVAKSRLVLIPILIILVKWLIPRQLIQHQRVALIREQGLLGKKRINRRTN